MKTSHFRCLKAEAAAGGTLGVTSAICDARTGKIGGLYREKGRWPAERGTDGRLGQGPQAQSGRDRAGIFAVECREIGDDATAVVLLEVDEAFGHERRLSGSEAAVDDHFAAVLVHVTCGQIGAVDDEDEFGGSWVVAGHVLGAWL